MIKLCLHAYCRKLHRSKISTFFAISTVINYTVNFIISTAHLITITRTVYLFTININIIIITLHLIIITPFLIINTYSSLLHLRFKTLLCTTTN